MLCVRECVVTWLRACVCVCRERGRELEKERDTNPNIVALSECSAGARLTLFVGSSSSDQYTGQNRSYHMLRRVVFLFLMLLLTLTVVTGITLRPPLQDVILETGKHSFIIGFPPGSATDAQIEFTLTGQETHKIRLSRRHERDPFSFIIGDPGSYFGSVVMINPVNESTRNNFAFEVVDKIVASVVDGEPPNPDILSHGFDHSGTNSILTNSILDHMSTQLREGNIKERPMHILHVSDVGRMDGYKYHMLQQLIHLPRGLYKQKVIDLTCQTDPGQQIFLNHLQQWGVDVREECMQVPGPSAEGGWASIAAWHNDLRLLDDIDSLEEAPDRMLDVLETFLQILQETDIMVITNGSGDYDSYLVALGRLTNTKVVLDLGPRGPTAQPWTTKGLSVFVAQSTYVLEHELVKKAGVASVQIPPIVDHSHFSYPAAQSICKSLGPTTLSNGLDGFLVVAFVARLASQKGPGMFIRAAAKAISTIQAGSSPETIPIKFVIIGVGPLQSALEALAKRLNIFKHIIFTGFIPNHQLQCTFLNIDVFVFSSLFHESFGMAAVEAMLMRRAVIGFGVGGSKDFLLHNKTAVLVQERTPHALGRAIIDVAGDQGLRTRLGSAAEYIIRQQYSPKRILYKIRALYQTLFV